MPAPAFRFVDLFAGLGGFHAALRGMGGECVYAVEIDRMAAAVYQHNWGIDPYRDITLDVNEDHVSVPAHEVLVASLPLQPFTLRTQRRMDEGAGPLFWYVLKIIQAHHPALVLIESDPALARPLRAHDWQVIIESLRDEGYRVAASPAFFSPHLLPPQLAGRPLVQERVYVTATFDPTHRREDPPAEPVAELAPVGGWDPRAWDLAADLPLEPEHTVPGCDLTAAERTWIGAWDDFVASIREATHGRGVPRFPLWADCWTTADPLQMTDETSRWRAHHIRQNQAFYAEHRAVIDAWTRRWGVLSDAFPATRRRLVWHAQDTPGLWDCVVSLRPTGIFATRLPSLPAVPLRTRMPIIGPRARRLTPREAARLQGLPEWFDFGSQNPAVTYRQLGNSVSVGAVWHVLKAHAQRDSHILARTDRALLDAIASSPHSPDEAMGTALGGRPQISGRCEEPAAELERFVPAADKLEAVNRLSALVGSGPQELGPGSKEKKSVLVDLGRGLGLALDETLSKPLLGAQICAALGQPWGPDCWSAGETITLRGLNRLLEGAEARIHTRRADDYLAPEAEGLRIVATLSEVMPTRWDGRTCIEEMRLAGDTQWAQDEWKGFFLEYLAGTCTSLGGRRNPLRYGSTTIDYALVRLWDFKVHDARKPTALLNDMVAFDACVEDQGGLGFIVVSGAREIEEGFRQWQKDHRQQHGKVRRKTKKQTTQPRYGTAAFVPSRITAYYFSIDTVQQAIADRALTPKTQGRQTTTDKARNRKYELHLKRAATYVVAEISLDTANEETPLF